MEADAQSIFGQPTPPTVCDIYNFGISFRDFNKIFINGYTLLEYCLLRWPEEKLMVHALLQCGCDLTAACRDRPRSVFSWATSSESTISSEVREVIHLYNPGIIAAVQRDNLGEVRKLINLWCRVDVERDEKSAKEFALDRGTERIITLLLRMGPSLELAHAVLADNFEHASHLLTKPRDGGSKIDVNVKNMGAYGATPLCFAIQHDSAPLVELLLKHGANLRASLSLADESELPLVMLGLRRGVSWATFRVLVDAAVDQELMEGLRYEASTVLHFAIAERLEEDRCRYLLSKLSPKLISVRNEMNLTAQEMASDGPLAPVFDEHMHQIFKKEDQAAIMDLIANGNINANLYLEDKSVSLTHRSLYKAFRDHIQRFVAAVEAEEDEETITDLLYFRSEECRVCVADCRAMGDGQPTLHKTVLRVNADLVRLLADAISAVLRKRVDDVRDQHFRTALCYAYAISSAEDETIPDLLIGQGASEFAQDRAGRSPLSFRELRGTERTFLFLDHHRERRFDEPEPDLWAPSSPDTPGSSPPTRLSSGRSCADSACSHANPPRLSGWGVGWGMHSTPADVSASCVLL